MDESEGKAWVRIEWVGLCRTDLLAAQGEIKCVDGVALGHECSGRVVSAALY